MVIRPLRSRSSQRCLLSYVQWLPRRRGDSLCAKRPSSKRFSVESIHPKHNASSTTSRYGNTPSSGCFARDIITQHSRTVAWFISNQRRSSERWRHCKRFTISMPISRYSVYDLLLLVTYIIAEVCSLGTGDTLNKVATLHSERTLLQMPLTIVCRHS